MVRDPGTKEIREKGGGLKDVYLILRERLIDARRMANMSQRQMADALNLSHVGYGAYERGDRSISIETLIQIAEITNQPLSFFFDLHWELSTEENQLLSYFRRLPKDARALSLASIRAFAREMEDNQQAIQAESQ